MTATPKVTKRTKTTIRPSILRTIVFNWWSAALVTVFLLTSVLFLRFFGNGLIGGLFALIPITIGAVTWLYWDIIRYTKWTIDWGTGEIHIRKRFSQTESEGTKQPLKALATLEVDPSSELENRLANSPLRCLAAGTFKIRQEGGPAIYTIGPIRDPDTAATQLRDRVDALMKAKEETKKRKAKKAAAKERKAAAAAIADEFEARRLLRRNQ